MIHEGFDLWIATYRRLTFSKFGSCRCDVSGILSYSAFACAVLCCAVLDKSL